MKQLIALEFKNLNYNESKIVDDVISSLRLVNRDKIVKIYKETMTFEDMGDYRDANRKPSERE
jgi:hypothetical protein